MEPALKYKVDEKAECPQELLQHRLKMKKQTPVEKKHRGSSLALQEPLAWNAQPSTPSTNDTGVR